MDVLLGVTVSLTTETGSGKISVLLLFYFSIYEKFAVIVDSLSHSNKYLDSSEDKSQDGLVIAH